MAKEYNNNEMSEGNADEIIKEAMPISKRKVDDIVKETLPEQSKHIYIQRDGRSSNNTSAKKC